MPILKTRLRFIDPEVMTRIKQGNDIGNKWRGIPVAKRYFYVLCCSKCLLEISATREYFLIHLTYRGSFVLRRGYRLLICPGEGKQG